MTAADVPRPIAVNGHLGGTASSFVGGAPGLPDTTHPAARPTPPAPSNQPATSLSTPAAPAQLKTHPRPSGPWPPGPLFGATAPLALRAGDSGCGRSGAPPPQHDAR